jgi:hypothetical protein
MKMRGRINAGASCYTSGYVRAPLAVIHTGGPGLHNAPAWAGGATGLECDNLAQCRGNLEQYPL